MFTTITTLSKCDRARATRGVWQGICERLVSLPILGRVVAKRDDKQQQRWTAVERHIAKHFIPSDPVLDFALRASKVAGLPSISVSPSQGKLLTLLARTIGARTILEIGTLGGYSTIWLARALDEGGRLVTLESHSDYAKVARNNIVRAGLANRVELRLGRALDVLPTLSSDGPFDFVFIDADHVNMAEYFRWAVKLSHAGSLIVVDNVVRQGRILKSESRKANTQGIRRFYEIAAADPKVSATALQTVGAKGHDGFAIALVLADP